MYSTYGRMTLRCGKAAHQSTPFSRFTLKQYLIDSRHDIYVDKQLRLIVELKESAEPAGAVDLYDFDPFNRRAGVGILIDKKFRKQGWACKR